MRKTILILASNPQNTMRLRLDEEVREIENGLDSSANRDKFMLKQKWAPRPEDVRRAMLNFKPNIVHFCGHGYGENGIAFEDESGQAKLIAGDVLAEFFGFFVDRLECVVLNACYTEELAEAIGNRVPYVIGINAALEDTIAIKFSVAFYDAIGAGKTVDVAFQIARNAIQWEKLANSLMPVLVSRLEVRESIKISQPEEAEMVRIASKTSPSEEFPLTIQVFNFKNRGEEVDRDKIGEIFSDFVLYGLQSNYLKALHADKNLLPPRINIHVPRLYVLEDEHWPFKDLVPFIAVVGSVVYDEERDYVVAIVSTDFIASQHNSLPILVKQYGFQNTVDEMHRVAEMAADDIYGEIVGGETPNGWSFEWKSY